MRLEPQAPLEPEQIAYLHGWERFLVRFYVGAMLAVLAATALGMFVVQSEWARRSVLGLIIALFVGAALVQWRVRCPRCKRRLGFKSRLRFPDFCPHCRAPFPRPES